MFDRTSIVYWCSAKIKKNGCKSQGDRHLTTHPSAPRARANRRRNNTAPIMANFSPLSPVQLPPSLFDVGFVRGDHDPEKGVHLRKTGKKKKKKKKGDRGRE